MAYVDFKAVKQSVPIESILAHYNLKLRRVNQITLKGACPIPAHTSKGEESFSVNTEKNCWACHSDSCKAARGGKTGGNLFDLVAAMESCTIREAAEKAAGWFSVDVNGDHQSNGAQHPAKREEHGDKDKSLDVVAAHTDNPTTAVEENKPLTFTLKTEYCDFLKARGLTQATCERFGVGLCISKGSMAGRVVVPIRNPKGEVVAYIGRSVDGSEPKWKFPVNFHASLEVFNIHQVSGKQVTIVEGPFDVMWLAQCNIWAVALLGKSLSDAQAELISSRFKGTTILLDGDQPGREAADKVAAKLSRKMWVRIVDLPTGKDPDELSPEVLTELLK